MDELEKKRRLGPATDEEVIGRLLKAAKPKQDAAREAALLDRIVAAAERTPRAVATAPQPAVSAVPPPKAQLHAVTPRRPSRTSSPSLLTNKESWSAAGLLAASLLIGFLAGQTTLTQTAMQRVAEASGVSLTAASQDVATVLAAAEHEDEDL